MKSVNVKSVFNMLLCLCMTLLIGCAGTGSRDLPPVVDRDEEPATQDEDYPVDMQPPLNEVPEEDRPPKVVAPAPLVNPAVVSLLNQARAQYNARNYQAAIATAERGLRIDRRAADLYLVLAQSYLQMSMPQQAESFVQQGLRFTQTGSNVGQSLLRVREIISGGNF